MSLTPEPVDADASDAAEPAGSSPDALVALRHEGVALVLDLTDGRLPSVLHWGADLGELTAEDLHALSASSVPPVAPNNVDASARVVVLPEHWTGWVGRPGLSGSRAGRGWSPQFHTTGLAVDGAAIDQGPATVCHVAAAGQVDIVAEDLDAGLRLALSIGLVAGGIVTLQAELTNTGEDDYTLDDLVLTLPVPLRASEVLDFGGRWGKERMPQRRAMTQGTHLRENRKGRTGADAATVLHLGTPGFGFAAGEVWGLHTGWSGNHTHYAERLFNGEQVIGGGELLLPGELVLAPGESYRSPVVYGSFGRGLDEVARRFHRHLRARPQHPSTPRPVTLNVWEAVYFDHDLERLLALAERAADVGVERYVLDDGWFGSRRNDRSGLGDWTVSPDAWPEGLHPLIDRVHELGMQFGLWFEPEMVNPDSDVARAHPEWIMTAGSQWPIESRHQQVINLGLEDCYAYVRDAILAILAEYDIGYLKWDHNRDLIEAGTQPSGRPGVHAQTAAFYRLLDEIKAAHPGLEIESCSSGGARVDLGVLQRTDRIWVSDCIDPLERQQMNRWTTQLVPPEMMGSHIASGRSHTTGRVHDLSFRAATAVFGHLGIEWDLTAASDAELRDLTQWVAFYREHRDLLHSGVLVRADTGEVADTLYLHGVVAPDRSRALYSYAVVSRSALAPRGHTVFPGLDPERRYRIAPVVVGTRPHGLRAPDWWPAAAPDEEPSRPQGTASAPLVLTGAALAEAGVQAPLLDAEQAVLFSVEAVD